ncbi:hypothetical protein PR048_002215 [Dryococelus australis]|uniref:Uncharacterized protein n=1 Tax=Dryococelus australis TaxID=614101 RepID=A0ABQ9IJJ4_9NEOP|nr:hypothetical protein PR048_002215 [Dryococelus australis]
MRGRDFSLNFYEATDSNRGTARQFAIVGYFMMENKTGWSHFAGVCTNGSRSMGGSYNGLQVIICAKAPCTVWAYCIFHKEALA